MKVPVVQTAEISCRPLSASIGAEVSGIDLTRPVGEGTREALRAAWKQYALLLFRDQELSTEDHFRAIAIFGSVSLVGESNPPDGVVYVSNTVEDGVNPKGPLGFHFDHSFYETPLRGLSLYAIQAPPEGAGGETLFSNAKAAYQNLPEHLRTVIQDMLVRHGYPDLSKAVENPGMDTRPEAPRSVHRLAFQHPGTGETILFLSRRHADGIIGLSRAKSEALLDELTTYLRDPAVVYKHSWRPKDLIVWDNLTLQHARTDGDPAYPRHLRRLQIGE